MPCQNVVFTASACLVVGCAELFASNSLPIVFEPLKNEYRAHTPTGDVSVGKGGFRLNGLQIKWINAQPGKIVPEQPTGGWTNYVAGADPAQWRTLVPHFRRVRVTGQYPGIETAYYSVENKIEFDTIVKPFASVQDVQLQFERNVKLAVDPSGDLYLSLGTERYRFRKPQAFQEVAGKRVPVECDWAIRGRTKAGFAVGAYDNSQELIIDPVIEYASYLGGNHLDWVQHVRVDSEGRPVLSGWTTSTSFPGLSNLPPNTTSLFVTRLNKAGTAVEFTTVLASASTSNSTSFQLAAVEHMTLDGTDIYVLGRGVATAPPPSQNAWRSTGGGQFVSKLDGLTGQPVFSTFLGRSEWALSTRRIRVRDGILYAGGVVGREEFLGTTEAYQRQIAGGADMFVLALAKDGSRPLFVTALGGVGQDELTDFELGASGEIIITGRSASASFPGADNAPLRVGDTAIIATLESTGSRLRHSRWLGTRAITRIERCSAGEWVIAGDVNGPLLLPGVTIYDLPPAERASLGGYVAKLSADTLRPLWVAALPSSGHGIACDTKSNVLVTFFATLWRSGGSFSSTGQWFAKLSNTGDRLLYSTGVPVTSFSFSPSESGVWMAGLTSSVFPVTGDALQASLIPTAVVQPHENEFTESFVAKLNLDSFSNANYLVSTQVPILRWRIGEQPPPPLLLPVRFAGEPLLLEPTSLVPGLVARYVERPAPAIEVTVDPASIEPGEKVARIRVQAPSVANSEMELAVELRILPRVNFTLDVEQVEIRRRQGEQPRSTDVGITTDFGNEGFSFETQSSHPEWLFGSVSSATPGRRTLQINAGPRPPGTYEGVLVIRLQTLQNPLRTIRVKYIVDPPAQYSVSPSSLPDLHVVKGQPFRSVSLRVTSSPPGAKFSAGFGVSRTWIQVRSSGETTPGEVVLDIDSAAAELGLHSFSLWITGENDQRTTVNIAVHVAATPLDLAPTEVKYRYDRTPGSWTRSFWISVTSINPTTAEWSVDQPWVSSQSGKLETPGHIVISFEPERLREGVYSATLTVRAAAVTRTVPITFELYDIPTLLYPKDPLRFRYQIGSTLPKPLEISLMSSGLQTVSFELAQRTNPPFVTIDVPYGLTPQKVAIGINPAGLAAGTYETQVQVTAMSYSGGRAIMTSIPVTLEVVPDPSGPSPIISRVTGAASFLAGAVSPGEILVLFGSGLGPSTLVKAEPSSSSLFPVELAGTRFFFDDVPAPLIYVSATQAALVAPFGLHGKTEAKLTAEIAGRRTAPVTVPVSPTNPNVFTRDGSGTGMAAALNVAFDGSASVHGSANPAAPGSVVTLFATGLGVTNPPLSDGQIATAATPVFTAPVRVLIGGRPAEILYAGPAPQSIAGLAQLNVRIPSTAGDGPLTVLVIAGDAPSQPGVTLLVK